MPWELLARQTASAATPTNARAAAAWLSVDPSDPSAPNFSVLGQLRSLYGAGPYRLKMSWPKELPEGDNEWMQSSAPDQAIGRGQPALGYKALSIKHSCNSFAGLQKCDSSGPPAYVCNLSADGQWYYPIGTDVAWEGAQLTFPGPCGSGVAQGCP